MKVVDASVVLRWLLEEPPGGSAGVLECHLSGREVLLAPELLRYEVGNILVSKSSLVFNDAADLFDHFLKLEIQTYTLGAEEHRESLVLACKFGITAHDASYLALAVALNVRLVTADRRLATRAQSLGIVDVV